MAKTLSCPLRVTLLRQSEDSRQPLFLNSPAEAHGHSDPSPLPSTASLFHLTTAPVSVTLAFPACLAAGGQGRGGGEQWIDN